MTRYTDKDIAEMEKGFRTVLINSITGFKSANLIGTISENGQENLAIFSSVIHLGSNPATIGFITRPTEVDRHTYQNILATRKFTVNHVTESITQLAHQTSARYPREISEFEACGLESERVADFPAPFVKGSPVRLGCEFAEELEIKTNGTRMIVAHVHLVELATELLGNDGYLDLHKAGVVAISSADAYHAVSKPVRYAYAKKDISTKIID